jgi:hypothetical protein
MLFIVASSPTPRGARLDAASTKLFARHTTRSADVPHSPRTDATPARRRADLASDDATAEPPDPCAWQVPHNHDSTSLEFPISVPDTAL